MSDRLRQGGAGTTCTVWCDDGGGRGEGGPGSQGQVDAAQPCLSRATRITTTTGCNKPPGHGVEGVGGGDPKNRLWSH